MQILSILDPKEPSQFSNALHTSTTFLLYPMRLYGQTNIHPSRGQTNPQGRESALILFVRTHTQPYIHYPL